MGWRATLRVSRAVERWQQRDAKKRQRELLRSFKEQAKLSALEQARLEVETYENGIEVLLSVHKEQQEDRWDWPAMACSLAPVGPERQSHNEFRAKQRLAVATARTNPDSTIEQARLQDDREFQEALQSHSREKAEWEKMKTLARRVLAREAEAYVDALREFNPFAELASVGSSLNFKIHSAGILECVLSIHGRKAIPSEVKTLTASGKVSVKPMPKGRFIDIYRDYVCGCVLRVAREAYALLPIDVLLVTAVSEGVDSSTGQTVERPVLSVAIPRAALELLNFEKLDPSDAVMAFNHRGELTASRKTGEIEFTSPLMPADLPPPPLETSALPDLMAGVKRLRAQLTMEIERLHPQPPAAPALNGDT